MTMDAPEGSITVTTHNVDAHTFSIQRMTLATQLHEVCRNLRPEDDILIAVDAPHLVAWARLFMAREYPGVKYQLKEIITQ